MPPSVLHPVCMSKSYRCRKETKKKQAEHERVTQQSTAKHKWSVCAFKNHPLEPWDTLWLTMVSFSPIQCLCMITLQIPSWRWLEKLQGDQKHAGWIKAEHFHIRLLGIVKVSLQPGPSQGCIWFSRFQLQMRLTSTALHTQDKVWEWSTTRGWYNDLW